MRRTILAIATVGALVTRASGDNVFQGSGILGCVVINAIYERPTPSLAGNLDAELSAWMSGFMTAFNMMRLQKRLPTHSLPDEASLLGAIKQFCAQNPAEDALTGISKIYNALPLNAGH